MKRVLVIIVLLFCTINIAQTISEYHVGALYSLAFEPASNWDRQESFNFRSAFEIVSPTWEALNLTAKGRFIFTTPTEQSLGQLWLIHKNILGDFSLGKQPRPISIQKPNPASCDAGFEPVSKLVIPGATFGFLYSSSFDPSLTLQVGIYDPGDHLAQYNAGMQAVVYGLKLNLAGYLSKNHRGVALSADDETATCTMYFSDKNISLYFEYKDMVVKPYFDMAYDRKTNTDITTEFGITKEFVNPIESLGLEAELKWLLGLAYNATEEKVMFY